MKCARLENLLLPYLENELSPEKKLEVEAHLRTCQNCSRELENLKKVSLLLASFPEFEVSPALQTRLYSLPAQFEMERRPRWHLLDFFLKPSAQPVIAAACIFLIFISFFFYHPDGRYLSQSFKEKINLSLGRIEKTVAKMEGIPGYLPLVQKNIIDSLKHIFQPRADMSEKI